MSVVLDASALLAYWLDEPGADVVTERIAAEGALIAAPNLAEALTKLIDRRPALAAQLHDGPTSTAGEGALSVPGIPLAGGAIAVEPFTVADAVACARLRPGTRPLGLSLGDRACLALGQRMQARVLTADRAWATLSIGVSIVVIR